MYCESRTELAACIQRELDPNVIAYTTQPMTVNFKHNGKSVSYTPDVLVLWRDGAVSFEEVKPHDWVEDEAFLNKLRSFELAVKHPVLIKRVRCTAKNFESLDSEYYQFRMSRLSHPTDAVCERQAICPDQFSSKGCK
ncbi:MAG: Tn7 transposase TnsA N-terminal domain-containing protein [Pseudomonadota bacterium]